MYNKAAIQELVDEIKKYDGIADKNKLEIIIKEKFDLSKDRSIYYCDDYAVRFCQGENTKLSNTILALRKIQKYDSRPVIVCIVSSKENYLLLMNSTFLKKVSHSSHTLRVDNIRGNVNAPDIMKTIGDLKNCPENFEELFAIHEEFSFEENLERLVEATNNIAGRGKRCEVTEEKRRLIEKSVERAAAFIESAEYEDLNNDLSERVKKVQNEIVIAASIDNINIRGRVIEYLITEDDSIQKEAVIQALNNNEPLPPFVTEDKLGDFSKEYVNFITETDIKSKVLSLSGEPKAYNIDKLLTFLSEDKSVYMVYLVGINQDKTITAKLCSVFDERLLDATRIVHHWAGRNSRGVAQFSGKALVQILNGGEPIINEQKALEYLQEMIDR